MSNVYKLDTYRKPDQLSPFQEREKFWEMQVDELRSRLKFNSRLGFLGWILFILQLLNFWGFSEEPQVETWIGTKQQVTKQRLTQLVR